MQSAIWDTLAVEESAWKIEGILCLMLEDLAPVGRGRIALARSG